MVRDVLESVVHLGPLVDQSRFVSVDVPAWLGRLVGLKGWKVKVREIKEGAELHPRRTAVRPARGSAMRGQGEPTDQAPSRLPGLRGEILTSVRLTASPARANSQMPPAGAGSQSRR